MKQGGGNLARRRRRLTARERALVAIFHRRVWELDEGRCSVLGIERSMFSPFLQRHHVIPKERMRRDGYPLEVIYDPDVGMLVDLDTHTRHTDAFDRIPRDCIPLRAINFAARHGYLHMLDDGVIYPRRQTNDPKGVH